MGTTGLHRAMTILLGAVFVATSPPARGADEDVPPPRYGWEKELGWKIRFRRGPMDASGDLPTALRLLDRAGVAEQDKKLYAKAYEVLVARPDASFAELAGDTAFRQACTAQGRAILGGPMLGAIGPHGARVWVRTVSPAEVRVLVTVDGKDRTYGPVRSTAASDLSAVVPVDGLEPATTYRYRVMVDGVAVDGPVDARLTTAPLDTALGRTRIAFGGDFHRWGLAHRPLFDQILARDPLAMLLVGDIAVQDRFNHRGLHRADYLLRDFFPDWQRLVAQTPVYATWDDHDYLENDLGGRPPGVSRAQQVDVWNVFRRAWNNPAYGFNDDRRGVFLRTRIGPADVIMVDNKFFRHGDSRNEPSTLLGADQMRWLEEQLVDCKGPFVILSCGTMWSDLVSGGKDSWGRFAPEDRSRLFDLIEKHRIGGVLLIAGDRHGACGYRIPRPSGFSLYEFNVGCLGGIRGKAAPAGKAPEANGQRLYRFGEGYAFGEFEFDTAPDDPTVTFRLIGDDGRVLHEQALSRSLLTPAAGR